jgi:hypothetical protein
LIPDAETARQYVRDTAAQAIAELTERRELILLREQRDRELAVQEARQDTTKTGAQMLRFAESQDRRMRVGLKEARELRAARLAESDQVGGRRGTRRAAKPEPTGGVAPEPVVALGPVGTGVIEATPHTDGEELASEPKESVRRGSLTPPSARPEVSTLSVGPAGETCGPSDGGVWRPAPNDEPKLEELASEPKDSVRRGSLTPPSARPEVSTLSFGPGGETCGPFDGGVWRPAPNEGETCGPSEGGVWGPAPNQPHGPLEPSRDLNPRTPAQRPGETWEAYRPRDG